MDTKRVPTGKLRGGRAGVHAPQRLSWIRGLPLSLLVALVSVSAGAAPVLTVDPTSLVLVSTAPFGKNKIEYSYTAEVVNSGSGAQGVSAIVRTPVNGVSTVEGNLTFGDVGPGQRKRSTDTFTIRRLPGTPFDPATDTTWKTSFTSRSNEPPIANAGADQRVFQGMTVTLNGSASTDPDGDRAQVSMELSSANRRAARRALRSAPGRRSNVRGGPWSERMNCS